MTEAGCLAHARRKLHQPWVNPQSSMGEQALTFFGELYEVEREVCELNPMSADAPGKNDHARWPTRCSCGWPRRAKR